MKFKVFIAVSLDGFIAREDGTIDWLTDPSWIISGEDFGYQETLASVDALFMGRKTFDTVAAFDQWPYADLPVYVMSRTLHELPSHVPQTVQLINGDLSSAIQKMESDGHQQIYVDGGKLIQSMIRETRIDEMVITTLPILIGKGLTLFGPLHDSDQRWKLQKTKAYPNGLIQSSYTKN